MTQVIRAREDEGVVWAGVKEEPVNVRVGKNKCANAWRMSA